jgi:hypothetical protein
LKYVFFFFWSIFDFVVRDGSSMVDYVMEVPLKFWSGVLFPKRTTVGVDIPTTSNKPREKMGKRQI